jgi:aryl-alcohol dehydrogenase-like predicted oxidoreductase
MKKRQLGKEGPMLTEIGLGTWAIGGPWEWGWGPQDDGDSINTIHKALELGINWIDTAPSYGLGHSEEIIGRAIKGRREKIFIATKCGLVWKDNAAGKVENNGNPKSILKEAEDSLRRLQTDTIDLYQIHWPDPKVPVDESWQALIKLGESGKVRYIGVSNFNTQRLEACEKLKHVNSLQPPYSLLNRRVEQKILPWCLTNRTGVVAYSPIQSAILTDNFQKSHLARDDWRRRDAFFREPALTKNLQFVERIRPLAQKYGKSIAQFAIAWVLMNPAVTSAIVGARKPEQLEETIGGGGWSISPEDMVFIDKIQDEMFS